MAQLLTELRFYVNLQPYLRGEDEVPKRVYLMIQFSRLIHRSTLNRTHRTMALSADHAHRSARQGARNWHLLKGRKSPLRREGALCQLGRTYARYGHIRAMDVSLESILPPLELSLGIARL